MKKSFLWLCVSCVLVTSLVLASCTSTPTTNTTTSPTTTPATMKPTTSTTVNPTTATTTPQYGGALRYAVALQPQSLDPILGASGIDAFYWHQSFDQLVRCDRSFVPQTELSLAESWEFPDPTTMVFHLRKNVKFHDGTDFNADAVKFNIERTIDPATGAAQRASFMVINGVEVVDKYTVKFHLKNAWGAGLGMLSNRSGSMNSPTAVQKLGKDYGFNVSGTGPFKFLDYVSDASVSYVRNENYWAKDTNGNALPYLDKLTALIIPDTAVVKAALQTGDLDVAFVTEKDISNFEANPNISISSFGGGMPYSLLQFNRGMAPMDNVNLRRAICYAVNADAINKAVYFGKAIVAKASMWPPGSWVYDDTVPRPYYDQAKAKEFLKAGGYPDGFKMEVLTFSGFPCNLEACEMIQAQLAEVGIDINFTVVDVNTSTQKFYVTCEYAMRIGDWGFNPEPDTYCSAMFSSNGFYNPGKVVNAEVDALITKGASLYDINERKAVYRQIQDITLNECWYVPILYQVPYTGVRSHVGGIDTIYTYDARWWFRSVWIKQ
ncbi:MAG: ABC transporter substrate-binding protein [Dehalococcoidales bacterium]|nr:ABC transporter substrate-binding protein [Dehalococcoidales bacterium]